MNLQGLFALSVSVGKIDQLVAAKSRFVEADGNLRIQILAFLLVAAAAIPDRYLASSMEPKKFSILVSF